MYPRADIRSISALQRHPRDLIARARESRRPVVITVKGEAEGVLLDFASYQELRSAIALLKLVSLGEQDFKAGRVTGADKVFDELDAELDRDSSPRRPRKR